MAWRQLGLFALAAVALRAADAPVILISIDTLRADHLSAYGYAKLATPHIDSFAQGGTLFTDADAQIPLTLPSHTSLFTSTYPFENRVEENGERVPAGLTTLASVLEARGYKTAAFVGSCLLNRELGLDRGFGVYDSPFHLEGAAAENPYSVRVRRDGALVIRAARQWLDANRGQAVLAFLHFFDMHAPYAAPGAAGKTGVAGYDAELEYVDQLMGRLRTTLEQGGWWDRAVVILLADHGEGLGDHGETNHGYFIYRSTLHVPLIVHWPTGSGAHPPRVTEPVALMDVAPGILDFLHIPAPASFHGVSLLKLAEHPIFAESVYPRDAFQWSPLYGLREGFERYISAPHPELYDLRADPGELHNVFEPGEPIAKHLTDMMSRYAPKQAAGPEILPQMRTALGSLGYLGSGASGGGRGAADPKDRLAEFNLYEKALAALYGGHLEKAAASFRELLQHDARNTMARYYLGDALLRAGKPDDAVREWTAALERDPSYAPADEAIGAVWMGRGDYGKARAAFSQALAVDPQDYPAEMELGVAYQREGKLKEARQHVESACKGEPDMAQCGALLKELQEKSDLRPR